LLSQLEGDKKHFTQLLGLTDLEVFVRFQKVLGMFLLLLLTVITTVRWAYAAERSRQRRERGKVSAKNVPQGGVPSVVVAKERGKRAGRRAGRGRLQQGPQVNDWHELTG
jgi:hypothetical protein